MKHDVIGKPCGFLPTRRAFTAALGALGLGMVTVPLLARSGRAAENLTYFTWSGYEIPELHRAYIEKYGGSPSVSFLSDEEDALQKVRGGFTPDIAHPCVNTIGRWRDAGVLKPIDTARIRAWDDIFPQFLNIQGVQADGQYWMVPFDWGTTSIIYRTDLVEIDEPSWSLMIDERYKGRLAFLDSPDNVAAIAGLLVGARDTMRMTDEELARAEDALRKLRDNLRFYWTDPAELEQGLASGEIVAGWGWGSSMANLKRENVPVAYMNPKEGVMTWLCGLTLIKGGEAPEDQVYDFLNAMLSPESGANLIEIYGNGHANRKSFERVAPERLAELGLTDPQSFLAMGNFFEEVPRDTRQKIVQMWELIKAGG